MQQRLRPSAIAPSHSPKTGPAMLDGAVDGVVDGAGGGVSVDFDGVDVVDDIDIYIYISKIYIYLNKDSKI